MPTATETGIRVDASDKRAGLDYGRNKTAEARKSNSTEFSRNGNNAQSPDKRRVKNQAEIERRNKENEFIRVGNERIERQQREINEAVDGALKLVSERLSSQNLSESERARLNWVKNSVKNARDKADAQGRYLVEAKEGEKVTASRMEGVPIEILTEEVDRAVDEAKNVVKYTEQVERLKAKAEANTLDEQGKKREWRKVFDQLPEGNLKKRIIGLAKKWEIDDNRKYTPDEMDYQLGEACFKAIKEHTQGQMELLKQRGGEKTREAERLGKIFHTLQGGSDRYFFQHYKKFSANLDAAEKQKQHAYTTREAHLISLDPAYREILLGDYKSKLPKDFEKMDKQRQDYELAMVALDNRLLLKLPEKKELLPDIKPEYEQVQVTKPEGRWIPVEPARKPTILKEPGLTGSTDVIPKRPEATPGLSGSKDAIGSKDRLPKKLFLIDISEIAKRMAWTQVEERIQKEYKDVNRFKRAWKGLTENKRRIEYYQQALNTIKSDNNLMAAINERISGSAQSQTKAVISPEYQKLLDSAVGEYENEVADSQREVGQVVTNDSAVQAAVRELLIMHANNSWGNLGPEFQNMQGREAVELYVKNKIVPLLQGKQWSKDPYQQSERKGILFASNFWNVAEAYKGSIQQQSKAAAKEFGENNKEAVEKAVSKHLEGVLNLELQLGYKERDLVNNRPKGILKFYEEMVNKVEDRPLLSKIVLNPFMIGAGTVVGSRLVQRGLKWGVVGTAAALGATGFWVPIAAGAVLGGAFRAMKRSKDVAYDQAQELRQQTLGGKASEVLGENGELGYGDAVMSFKDAQATVDALKAKPNLTDEEKQQLAKIYARLELERDMLRDKDKKYSKVDLFNLDEETGKAYGSTAAAKAELRIALSKLGFSEKQLENNNPLRNIIDAERATILFKIKEINKQQESFRKMEMGKAFLGGAVMGVAGALIAKEIQDLAKEALHLGREYASLHHTSLEKMGPIIKGSPAGTPLVEHLASASHDRSPAEYLAVLKGHVDGGGQVETARTHEWYDNNNPGESSAGHIHNANELKFFINKDAGGNLHFKVPVEAGSSWVWHGQQYDTVDIDKAFAEGNIKIIFAPDASGSGAHEVITFTIDPATKELVIPPGSNIRNLFDENGRFLGKGYFGLAQEAGQNPDGSKIFNWINSDRGNGHNIDYGKTIEQMPTQNNAIGNKLAATPNYNIDHTPVTHDSDTIPTVPLTRKVWLRPGEKAAREEKANREAENKRAERAAKEKAKTISRSSRGESGGGGGNKEKAKESSKDKTPEFKGDVLKRYLNSAYAEELLREYEAYTGTLAKIDKKAIKFAIEGDKNKGKFVSKPLKEEQAKAVWELEQALIIGKVIRQEQADVLYEELQPAEKAETKTEKEKSREEGKDKTPKPERSVAVKKVEPEKKAKPEEVQKMDAEVQATVDSILEKYPVVKKIEFKQEDGKGFTVLQQKNRVDAVLKTLKMMDLEGKKGKSFDIIFSTDSDQTTSHKENKIIIPIDDNRFAVQKLLGRSLKRSDRLESKKATSSKVA